jgi:hypothetical protein
MTFADFWTQYGIETRARIAAARKAGLQFMKIKHYDTAQRAWGEATRNAADDIARLNLENDQLRAQVAALEAKATAREQVLAKWREFVEWRDSQSAAGRRAPDSFYENTWKAIERQQFKQCEVRQVCKRPELAAPYGVSEQAQRLTTIAPDDARMGGMFGGHHEG